MSTAGNPVLSRDHLESVVQNAFTQSYGVADDDHASGILLNNIAVLYQELGRFVDADTFYKRAVSRWERILPPNHPWIAQNLSNRAALYRQMEVYPEAERVFQEALSIWRRTQWPVVNEWPAKLESRDLATAPLWSEQPVLTSGHVLPRYRIAVQAVRKGVQAGDPGAAEVLHKTLERLGPWYHNVDLGNGFSTRPEGGDYPNAGWEEIRPFVPDDLSGKTVLDIGCNSGFFSFRMKERNAARVVGLDVMPHNLAQARFLSQWFDHPLELYEVSPYDVDQLHTRFDLVVFIGVLHHLKHPLYALEKAAGVCRDVLYFQTATTGTDDGEFVPRDDYSTSESDIFAHPSFPRLFFIEKSLNGDVSNWWFATRSCVKAMLRVAGFEDITDTSNSEVLVCHRSEPPAENVVRQTPDEIVDQLWGTDSAWKEPSVIHWTQHSRVQQRLNQLVSGDRDKNRFEYFMERYCKGRMPFRRVITLGCGHGELERGLSPYNFSLTYDAVDISQTSIDNARRLAENAGLPNIDYRTANLNNIELPPDTYDVVFGISSVHHTERLEHLFNQVANALKPDGYFFLDEFIGPTQFQWTTGQIRAINEALAAMPARYLQCVDERKGIKSPVTRPTIEEMNRIDPTEAIRSADIVPLLKEYFDIVDFHGCGGTMLHMLLEDIAGNFTENDPDSMQHLESLFELEDSYIQTGKLPHDFAVIIARKKGSNKQGATTPE